jgi:glycosyltransferase involved in cell wall biosynthesis
MKLSVVIPVYKVPPEYLRVCLDSLVAQNLQDCEFIIVSDGAPEAECSICEEYASKDSRFKFFKREHAGVSATRNFGIDQAQGEYITFVDSDDWIEASYTSTISSFKGSPDIIFFQFNYFNEKNKPYHFPFPKNVFFAGSFEAIQEKLLMLFNYDNQFDYLGYTWNKFFKRNILEKYRIRFPEKIPYNEDEIFTLKYCKHISSIQIIENKLYNYRVHNSGLTKKKKDPAIYKEIVQELQAIVEDYTCKAFKNAIINKRMMFLRFLSVINSRKIIPYNSFLDFYHFFHKNKNVALTCLTLKAIFAFPPQVAYILSHFYKMISWMPGIRV